MAGRFGTLLRTFRFRAGLTQEELAERSGVSVRTIGRIEADQGGNPRVSSVQQLANALSLSGADREELVSAVYAGSGDNRQSDSLGLVTRRSLPPSVSDFTGRQAEMSNLVTTAVASADDAVAVLLIDGMAGVGKTALAVHVAHALAEQYPDGQFFCDLHGFTPDREPLEPTIALELLLRMAGVPGNRIPDTVEARAAIWRDAMAGRRVLVLLDNVRDAAQIRPLLPGTPGCLVMVTSRRRFPTLPVVSALTVDTLPRSDAVNLFTAVAGSQHVADDPASVEDIVRSCGYLPLAIRIAGSRLAHRPAWSPAYLARRLHDGTRRLAELTGDDTRVDVAFTLSYKQLAPRDRRVFKLLGLHPGNDITSHAAAALVDMSVVETEATLERLVDCHLLLESQPCRYTFHDLLRSHVTALADASLNPADRHEAVTRLFDYYLHSTVTAIDLLLPSERELRPKVPDLRVAGVPGHSGAKAADAWLASEMDNLIACAVAAPKNATPSYAILLSAILWRWLDEHAHYTSGHELHTVALDVTRTLDDQVAEADTLRFLGTLYRRWGRYEEAASHHEQSLQLARRLGDRVSEARTLNNLGAVYQGQGCYTQAAECHRHSLKIFRELGIRTGQGYVLNSLGNVNLWLGDYRNAVKHHTQALQLFQDLGDRYSAARCLLNFGKVYQSLGRYGRAVSYYREARRQFREVGARTNEGHALAGLGIVYHHIRRFDLSVEFLYKALSLAQQTGERSVHCQTLVGLGMVTHAKGDPAKAIEYYRGALTIALETGGRHDQALAHEHLAEVYLSIDRRAEAHCHLRRALAICGDLRLPEPSSLRNRLSRGLSETQFEEVE